ncbi:MAG: class IV adenylate cyclase [Candidatus Omnitrophica bacterium]|nr:class IV adenylate cyclase [Candidatus Omnitrophota bacterium]
MRPVPGSYEIEQKYRIKNPKVIRAALKKLGARKIASGFESNELLDRKGELRRKKSVLRLRQYGKSTILTFKGPRLKVKGSYKKRVEIETDVEGVSAKGILEALGYKTFFHYSKTREQYSYSSCSIVLDHLSKLGWFLEIEGSPSRIGRIAKQLKFQKSDEEPLSYPQLLSVEIN